MNYKLPKQKEKTNNELGAIETNGIIQKREE